MSMCSGGLCGGAVGWMGWTQRSTEMRKRNSVQPLALIQGWQTSWCQSRKELTTETNPVGLQPVLDTGWEDVRLANGGGAEREVVKRAFL